MSRGPALGGQVTAGTRWVANGKVTFGGCAGRRLHVGREETMQVPQEGDKAMTKHKTGTREEWLAARLELLKAEKELTRRSDELRGGGRSCRGFGSTRSIDSRPRRAAPRWRTSSEGARSSSSTTSCSGPTTPPAARPARRSRTASTGSRHLANHDVMLWAVSRAPLAKLRRTSGGWAGRFPGRPRSAATSTSTSTSRSPRSNSAREASNTTTGASRRGNERDEGWRMGGACRRYRGHDRNR